MELEKITLESPDDRLSFSAEHDFANNFIVLNWKGEFSPGAVQNCSKSILEMLMYAGSPSLISVFQNPVCEVLFPEEGKWILKESLHKAFQMGLRKLALVVPYDYEAQFLSLPEKISGNKQGLKIKVFTHFQDAEKWMKSNPLEPE